MKAIKIKVVKGTGTQPQMVHPSFSWQGLPIAQVIDRDGIGMHYEVVNQIGNGATEMYALTSLPDDIAEAFALACPEVTILTDLEAKAFWENNITVNDNVEILDTEVLQAIKLKQDLKIALNQDDLDALDSTKKKPGIRKNPTKLWNDYKALRGI